MSRALFLGLAASLAQATEYDPTQGLMFMYASAAAYCTQSQITSWNCAACTSAGAPVFSNPTYLSNATTDDAGFVGADTNGNVWVSFRGTSNIENWINNLKFDKTPFPGCSGCEAHLGFTEDYVSLSAQMMSALTNLGAANAPAIYLTGHSLGGAMANYAAFELALAGYPVDTMINFGQPRVGNDAYAAGFTSYVIAGQDTGSQTDDTTGTKGHTTTTPPSNSSTTTAPPPPPSTHTGGTGTHTGGTGTHTGGTGTHTGGTGTHTGGTGTHTGGTGTHTGGTGTHTGTGGTSNSTATTATTQAVDATPAGRRAAFLSSMVSSDLRLNMVALADNNATRTLISPVMALAIEQALSHPLNAHLGISEGDRSAIVSALNTHAAISVAHANKALVSSPMRPSFTPRQLAILSKLRFPAFARAGRSSSNAHLEATIGSALLRGTRRNGSSSSASASASGLKATYDAGSASGAFGGAAAFRVTHWQDIVPHVPPEVMGFEHSIEEVWYVEDSSTYTRCSTTNGEDAKCSDGQPTDLSIDDHLHYLGQPISNLC